MKKQNTTRGLIKFNPIAASILLSLPMMAQAANIEMKNGNLTAANGVPVVNINSANQNGISHNVYDRLNVDKNGLIFNNSQNGANTVLGGQIAGNSNLSSGTASIILNEVTSRNASALNGMMEVAGDKAHLIIANPNGISVQGAGFINTEKATLTTGKPDMQNGELRGYSVSDGSVTVLGLQNASPTEILARSVVVKGDISAEEISVVAGINYVGTDAKVQSSTASGWWPPSYSIDVSSLGGMYANRINLVSTEKGVGVRNAGTIAAGTGGVQIDTNGRLINSNALIKTAGDVNVKINGSLENVTGKITAEKKIYLDTNKNSVTNTRAGNISAASDIYIESGSFDNTNGKIASGGMLALKTNNQTLTNSGKGNTVGINAAVVALETGTLNNNNGQIQGYYVGSKSSRINNTSGSIESYGDIDMSSGNEINNTRGLIRSSTGRVQLAANGVVYNNNTKTADTTSSDSLGILAGQGGIKITAGTLNNRDGQIASDADVALESRGNIDSYNGKVMTNGIVSIKGNSYNNNQGGTSGKKGVKTELTGTLDNHIGVLSSEDGDLDLKANRVNNNGGMILANNISIKSASSINNNVGMMVANKKLTLDAAADVNNSYGDNFGRSYGIYFGAPEQKGGLIGREGVEIVASSINNNYSRIIAEGGPLNLTATGTISSSRALLVGGGDSNIKARTLNNNYSTLYSKGNLALDVNSLSNYSSGSLIDNNATGIIASDKKLDLNVGSGFTNYGWISSKGSGTVTVSGNLTNNNTISSEGDLHIGANALSNSKDISALEELSLTTTGTVTNSRNGNIKGKATRVQSGDINNYGNLVADERLQLNSSRNIYNNGNMYTKGTASIHAKTVNNSGRDSYLGGVKGTELEAERVNNTGTIVGM
ncbi:MAG TPA: filamentous hemagglutinin N-terminal domain-containing protein [Buttiauxella sp.]|jgi:filamentous hemagglutinin family protein